MTAAAWQAIGTAADGTTSCTPAWPTHATGDLGLLFVLSRGSGVATPSGYSDPPTRVVTNGTVYLYCFYKFAASGAESTPTVSGGSNVTNGVIATVRNAHQTAPFHRFGSVQGNNATAGVFPAFTTQIDDLLVVQAAFVATDGVGPFFSAETNSSLTSLTERFDAGTATGNGGGYGIWSGTAATPGTIVSTTVTSSPNNIIGMFSMAIAPIADQTFSGTVTIDGAAAPNDTGGPVVQSKVYLYDKTQPAASSLCAIHSITGGAGAYSIPVPYNDHTYIPIYEQLTTSDPDVWLTCAGAPAATGTGRDIDHFSTGGGGLVPPSVGSAFIR